MYFLILVILFLLEKKRDKKRDWKKGGEKNPDYAPVLRAEI